MKINKIVDRLNLPKDEGVKLQGCANDCTEYRQKSKSDYNTIARGGYRPNGSESYKTIRDIKSIFGIYCYKFVSGKKSYIW